MGVKKNAVAALEIAVDLSQFCTKLEKEQRNKTNSSDITKSRDIAA